MRESLLLLYFLSKMNSAIFVPSMTELGTFLINSNNNINKISPGLHLNSVNKSKRREHPQDAGRP